MEKFVLIFRMDILSEEMQPSDAQMKEYMKQWNKWIGEIDAAGQLAEGGNHLLSKGKVLLPNGKSSEGPYMANNQSVAGYIIVLAKDMNEAVRLAEKCPILQGEGTSVEIRQAGDPGN